MRYHATPPPDVLERVAAEKQIASPMTIKTTGKIAGASSIA